MHTHAADSQELQSGNFSASVSHDQSQMSVVSEQELNVTLATDELNQVVCRACEHHGHLATHLRDSAQCLSHLRNEVQFVAIARAKKDTFIAKAILLLGGCPAPECPGGGNHVGSHLPDQCFEWYRILHAALTTQQEVVVRMTEVEPNTSGKAAGNFTKTKEQIFLVGTVTSTKKQS